MKHPDPITDKRLSDRAYRVIDVIHFLYEHQIPVSVRQVAIELGIGVGTAHRAIRELVDLGYLRVRHAGRGKRAVYEVRR